MTQKELFHHGIWLGAAPEAVGPAAILRRRFTLRSVRHATLRVIGLGFFQCYLNGVRVGEKLFLPLNSDYEPRPDFPTDEEISGHRIYVTEYDVTSYLTEGENCLALHFGGGWYIYDVEQKFGDPKAIWCLMGEDENGAFCFASSEEDRIGPSFVTTYLLTEREYHDYTVMTEAAFGRDFDDSAWPFATAVASPDTEYAISDCPADGVARVLSLRQTGASEAARHYDCGQNISGYPVLTLCGKAGDTVRVVFAEECTTDGAPDPVFGHRQEWVLTCDGTRRTVRPCFTWFGFRYLSVCGPAEIDTVEVIHSKVAVTAAFRSDNALLNWIHDTFLNTQLTNMHTGIPSDCPHIERRGYTGDGQLVCHAAMDLLDGEAFYRKWIRDILDCQDVKTGHVQYTAPYTRSGGGPGGWGCAIVEVPYRFYQHYGDAELLRTCYPAMLRYFDYLEANSRGDLVVSDKEGAWCLGDWCPPTDVILPAPFVNNYFYIRSLMRAITIAGILGREEDIPLFEGRITARKEALTGAYFNSWDGNFLGGVQGANAFAVDIGLGDDRTYANLVERYRKLGHYDTGIFGTELVTRVLFERGDGELATSLLLSDSVHSFGEMRRRGATTLWEYWPESLGDRSHNHPMFGAVVACFYDYLLGIRPMEGHVGYDAVEIAPVLVPTVGRLEGHRTLPAGRVALSYETKGGVTAFTVTVPSGLPTVFRLGDTVCRLTAGENRLVAENDLLRWEDGTPV